MAKSTRKEILDALHEENQNSLREWQRKLEQATEQVAYWERQVQASSTLATRAMLESWKE